MKGIDLMWYDITGSEDGIEYQILDTTNATHIKARAAQPRQLGSCVTTGKAGGHER